MKLKTGIKINGVKTEIILALTIADKVWLNHGNELVVTELTGGKHTTASLHYVGLAADLRTRYFTSKEKELVAKELQRALGENYDVVIEKTHIHLEFQPK